MDVGAASGSVRFRMLQWGMRRWTAMQPSSDPPSFQEGGLQATCNARLKRCGIPDLPSVFEP